MDINKIFQSKIFKGVLIGIAVLVVVLLIFGVGMIAGFKKASFSFRWGENYHRNFGGPAGGFLRDFGRNFGGGDFIEANGVFGQIIRIDPSTSSGQAAILTIKSRNNVEKVVLIKNDAVIRRFQETIKATDLKVNDDIVIIGDPNDAGQIEAKFIRLMPPPPGPIIK